MRNGVMSSVFFFKQKTADELRISDWSSDVCSSDLLVHHTVERVGTAARVVDGFGTRGQPAKQRPTSDLGLGDEAHHVLAVQQHDIEPENGRASCRGRGWQEVVIAVVDG